VSRRPRENGAPFVIFQLDAAGVNGKAGRGGFGDTGEAHANYGLFVFILAKNFRGLRIHEMKPSTRQTGDRLVTVLTRFLSGIALYVLAGFRAAIEERTH
jgi:hypothetical protein